MKVSELFSTLQRQAIAIGLREGAQAYSRVGNARYLRKILRPATRPLANAGLDALRRYAETAWFGAAGARKDMASALSIVGFSDNQIRGLDGIIEAHMGNWQWHIRTNRQQAVRQGLPA